jgi:hypothetical protein
MLSCEKKKNSGLDMPRVAVALKTSPYSIYMSMISASLLQKSTESLWYLHIYGIYK